MRHDATLAIRADLIHRIDALAGQRGHLSVPRIHDEVDQIRHIARSFHFDALESLAGTLQSALSVNGHGPVVLSYLDLMRDSLNEAPLNEAIDRGVPHPAHIAPVIAASRPAA